MPTPAILARVGIGLRPPTTRGVARRFIRSAELRVGHFPVPRSRTLSGSEENASLVEWPMRAMTSRSDAPADVRPRYRRDDAGRGNARPVRVRLRFGPVASTERSAGPCMPFSDVKTNDFCPPSPNWSMWLLSRSMISSGTMTVRSRARSSVDRSAVHLLEGECLFDPQRRLVGVIVFDGEARQFPEAEPDADASNRGLMAAASRSKSIAPVKQRPLNRTLLCRTLDVCGVRRDQFVVDRSAEDGSELSVDLRDGVRMKSQLGERGMPRSDIGRLD